MKPEKPFGWVHMTDGKWEDFFLYKDGVGECEDCEYCIPLYTAPVRSSDISQECVDETAKSAPPRQRSFYDDVGRLIKAGKGFYDDGTPIDYKEIQLEIKGVGEGIFECTKVFIPRPPKREWVGLTDHEISEWWWAVTGELPEDSCIVDFARAIEAKLKERNA